VTRLASPRRLVGLAVLLSALAVAWLPGQATAKAPRAQACAGGGPYDLAIQTVPHLTGIRFTLNGRTFVSQRDGIARMHFPRCGLYRLSVSAPGRLRPGLKAIFARWGDETFTPARTIRLTQDTRLEIGFDVYYLVREAFVGPGGRPVNARTVHWLVQSNSVGSQERFRPGPRRWLLGSRVARRMLGLQPIDVLYSIRGAVISGANAVREAEQRFYPARTQDFRIRLLFYTAAISSRDRLFGFSLGSGLALTYPDGHRERFRFEKDSKTTLTLPRGTYTIAVDAPGLESSVPISLTKDQVVDLKIVSYVDLAIVLELIVVVVGGLLLIRNVRKRRLGTDRLLDWAEDLRVHGSGASGIEAATGQVPVRGQT
jgi:hypothetical protein